MELIPILSTIILVATISTFLLAIGAYVLYKVRERKGLQVAAQKPAEIQAELVTPGVAPAPQVQPEPARIVQQPVYVKPQPAPKVQRQPIFVQQGPQPVQPRYKAEPTSYRGAAQGSYQPSFYGSSASAQNKEVRGSSYVPKTPEEKKFTDSKFLKYTTEGYVPATEDGKSGALKWR